MELFLVIGVIVGILAGIVQVVQYFQDRHEKSKGVKKQGSTDSIIQIEKLPKYTVPNNLPPRGEFVGRENEKSRIHTALCSRSFIVSIDGIGGIGKTSLALQVVHECLAARQSELHSENIAWFEGFIWTTARDRELNLNSLLDSVARTLDYPGIAQQPLDEKQISIRRLLQGQPYLIVVDNFETITDDNLRDFLLNLPEPTKSLITTREQKISQAYSISIRGLPEKEALYLIRLEGKRLGLDSLVSMDDVVLLQLYQGTGGAPLAIKWAIGQVKQRGQSLDAVFLALYTARGDIFEQVFARSWELLTADSKRVLMSMPFFATPASRTAIEAASDVHHFSLDDAVGQLVEMSLLEASNELDLSNRRYGTHPLTRAFALKHAQESPGVRENIISRLGDYFLKFSNQFGVWWQSTGYNQMELDVINILTVVKNCLSIGRLKLAWEIFDQASHFLVVRGYWNDTLSLAETISEYAHQNGDEIIEAGPWSWPIGWIFRHRGDLDRAEYYDAKALTVFEKYGLTGDIAYARRNLGRCAQERGQLDIAEKYLYQAFEYYQTANLEHQISATTTNLAELALLQGNLERALELGTNNLPLANKLGDNERSANLRMVLSAVYRKMNDLDEARQFMSEGLAFMRQTNRLDGIADCMFGLAQIELDAGNRLVARPMLTEALEIYRRLDMRNQIQHIEELLSKM